MDAEDTAPPPRAMMHLAGRSDRQGAMQLAIHLGLLAFTGGLVWLAEGWWLAPALLALGAVQAAFFAPFHETSHYTAFANRRANAVVGWAVALPSLHNWPMYQCFHRAHHLHTHDPARDPELLAPEPATLAQYAQRVLGLAFWRARFEWLRDGLRGDLSAYPYVLPEQAPRLIAALRAELALAFALALAAGALFGWQALLLYWIVPQLLGQVLLRMYLLTEHTGLPHTRNGLANTRTTLTTALLRLLMWNMPYHAEHHLYPFIPFHRLADAHAELRGKLKAVQPGYARWQWGFIRSLTHRSAT